MMRSGMMSYSDGLSPGPPPPYGSGNGINSGGGSTVSQAQAAAAAAAAAASFFYSQGQGGGGHIGGGGGGQGGSFYGPSMGGDPCWNNSGQNGAAAYANALHSAQQFFAPNGPSSGGGGGAAGAGAGTAGTIFFLPHAGMPQYQQVSKQYYTIRIEWMLKGTGERDFLLGA
jgi:hypothetical protein